jgi:hypothetical protein
LDTRNGRALERSGGQRLERAFRAQSMRGDEFPEHVHVWFLSLELGPRGGDTRALYGVKSFDRKLSKVVSPYIHTAMQPKSLTVQERRVELDFCAVKRRCARTVNR